MHEGQTKNLYDMGNFRTNFRFNVKNWSSKISNNIFINYTR